MMTPSAGADEDRAPTAPAEYTLGGSDPAGLLSAAHGLRPEDIESVDRLMGAMAQLRDAERELSEASSRYMQLGSTDMRALHFLIMCENTGQLATPGAISRRLELSSAATTKLLDRLEAAGHVAREPHPSDRRTVMVRISPSTRAAAERTVGAVQSRRVEAVSRLTPAERETVTAFLLDLARLLDVSDVDWAQGPTAPSPTDP